MKTVTLVRTGSPDKAFEIREAPIPTPGANQICVKTEAFGLNYADVMARMGMYDDAPPMPAVLGYDVVGRVHSIGPDVKGYTVGQRVAALTRFGGYAEYALTDYRAVVAIPEDMHAGVAAALCTQASTAYYCAEEVARIFPGDHVLINAAAGGVGTILVQLAKHKGAIVYGTAGSDAKLDYLREQGVDHPINYQKVDFEKAVRDIVGKRGLDLAFDSVGGTNFARSKRLLGSGGRIVAYGAAEMSGKKNIFRMLKVARGFGFFSPIPLLMKSKGIIGVNMLRLADDRPETLARIMQETSRLAVEGIIRPVVGGEFHYTEIAKAHEFLGGRGSMGKIIVRFDQ